MLQISLILSLFACGSPPPDPGASPEGKLCGRAYGSTIASLKDMYTQRGADLPEVTAKSEWVAKCVSMGFNEEQLKCLDPKIATGNPSCDAAMKDVDMKRKELMGSILKKGAPTPAEPAPEGGE